MILRGFGKDSREMDGERGGCRVAVTGRKEVKREICRELRVGFKERKRVLGRGEGEILGL